jgi:hypothetical protein
MLLLPLCQVRMKDLDRIVEGMEKGKLLVLCCMADWNPLCRKVISVLEAVNSRPEPRSPSIVFFCGISPPTDRMGGAG